MDSMKNTRNATETPLPVLDICNNLITIAGYTSAIENAKLPDVVISSNPGLATEYADWQQNIWQVVFESLINVAIFAESEEIHNLINEGVNDQSVLKQIINGSNNVPTVISRCDDVEGEINLGLTYVAQIQEIANNIKSADQAKISQLQKIVDDLNKQFDDMEQQLTDKALDNSKDVVVTIIDVGVAVATEEDPVTPLLKGIAQVGSDIINELVLSDEIQATLKELENEWNLLDQATLELAQVNLVLNQLNTITDKDSSTIQALNDITNDWQTICNVIENDTPDEWTETGLNQITEWANRMNRIQFYGKVSQTVTSHS